MHQKSGPNSLAIATGPTVSSMWHHCILLHHSQSCPSSLSLSHKHWHTLCTYIYMIQFIVMYRQTLAYIYIVYIYAHNSSVHSNRASIFSLNCALVCYPPANSVSTKQVTCTNTGPSSLCGKSQRIRHQCRSRSLPLVRTTHNSCQHQIVCTGFHAGFFMGGGGTSITIIKHHCL